MKKHLLIAVFCLSTCFAFAQVETTVDGVAYLIDNGEASVAVQDKLLSGDIVIPETITYNGADYPVTSVADEAFKGTDITSIILPDGITSLGKNCFWTCTYLRSVSLPDGITSLGHNCFRECKNLTSINLPNSITSIGTECFRECRDLVSINLPDSIIALGEFCFRSCCSLTSITLPERIIGLGEGCFMGCSSLTSITLPESITVLRKYCFNSCSNLLTVTCEWESLDGVSADARAFSNNIIASGAKLYVPKGTVEIYKAKEPWSNFMYIEEIESDGGTSVTNVADQHGVKVSRSGQYITVCGLDDGEAASLYTTSGQLLDASHAVTAGTVNLDTRNERGVLILKTAKRKVKIKN